MSETHDKPSLLYRVVRRVSESYYRWKFRREMRLVMDEASLVYWVTKQGHDLGSRLHKEREDNGRRDS